MTEEAKSLLNTKTIVPRGDVRAFEKQLFKYGFGYPIALGLNSTPKYSKIAKGNIGFIVNYNGEITDVDYDKNWKEYEGSYEEEINWEYFFDL